MSLVKYDSTNERDRKLYTAICTARLAKAIRDGVEGKEPPTKEQVVENGEDPVNNFCFRWKHEGVPAAELDRMLLLYGGSDEPTTDENPQRSPRP
ncbi:MAG: hypothetical protein ACLPT4_04855 [Verrucomicrobiia bacterium]